MSHRNPPAPDAPAPRFRVELVADASTAFPITLRRDGGALALLIPAAEFDRVAAGLPEAVKALCNRR